MINIQTCIFINGIFDIYNVMIHYFFGISFYSFCFPNGVTKDYLYFAGLYGVIRIYESIHDNKREYVLTYTSYLMEYIYYYQTHFFTTINLTIIMLCLNYKRNIAKYDYINTLFLLVLLVSTGNAQLLLRQILSIV